MNKRDYLNEHPWPAELLQRGKLVDSLWQFEFPYGLDVIWAVVTDTSRLNRRLSYGEMHFTEKDGRLHGEARMAGFHLQWIEIPWEWEYHRRIRAARDYSAGFANYVRADYLLEPVDADRTRVYIYFGWLTNTLFGKLVLPLALRSLESRYEKVINTLAAEEVKSARDQAALLSGDGGRDDYDSAVIPEKLEAYRRTLREAGIAEHTINVTADFFTNAPDTELYRLRVKELAHRFQLSMQELLLAFLHATRAGHLILSWDVICPHCRGVRSEVLNLGDIPEYGECEACDIDFQTTGTDGFEVTFHLHPGLRPVQQRFFCSAEPAARDHIKIQIALRPGEERRVPTLLNAGNYRYRTLGAGRDKRAYINLNLHERYPHADWSPERNHSGETVELATRPTLHLRNDSAYEITHVVEADKQADTILRPVDLFNFQDFRDLFANEALAVDIRLDVGIQTVLFTDMVGSTRFYRERGDQGAFAAVRKHFVTIFDVVREFHGAVVKTIGDAVMVVFTDPLNALQAALAMQTRFENDAAGSGVRIRVSLHRGACLAVNLNTGIDYFGNTVNTSAKLQALAGAGQIAFSNSIQELDDIRSFVHSRNISVESIDAAQTNLPVRAYRISVGK